MGFSLTTKYTDTVRALLGEDGYVSAKVRFCSGGLKVESWGVGWWYRYLRLKEGAGLLDA
jgi:hypothetical protein